MSIKNIIFKIEAKGNGIVNFDGPTQKEFLKKLAFNNKDAEGENKRLSLPLVDAVGYKHNNITLAKKNFFIDNNGNLAYKIKISNDCVRNALFDDEQVAQTPSVATNQALRLNHIGSEACLVRGYMLLNKENNISLKRKSALILTDFEQSCNGISAIELHSKSGSKENEGADSDKSEANLWFKENIGDISYTAKGGINLELLQFISGDPMFDRLAINVDEFETYKKYLSKRLPSFDSELNFYKLKNSIVGSTEYGLLLSQQAINDLVKYTLKKLLKLKIKRSKAYAELTNLKMLLVENPLTDNYNTPDDKWIDVTPEVIENLNLDYHIFYEIGEKTNTEEIKTKGKGRTKASK